MRMTLKVKLKKVTQVSALDVWITALKFTQSSSVFLILSVFWARCLQRQKELLYRTTAGIWPITCCVPWPIPVESTLEVSATLLRWRSDLHSPSLNIVSVRCECPKCSKWVKSCMVHLIVIQMNITSQINVKSCLDLQFLLCKIFLQKGYSPGNLSVYEHLCLPVVPHRN